VLSCGAFLRGFALFWVGSIFCVFLLLAVMTRQVFAFSVFGVVPAPQGSKKFVGNDRFGRPRMVESSKRLKPWRDAVTEAVELAMLASGDDSKFDSPVEVKAVFYVPRPKSVTRQWPSVPADLDKYCRSLLDGMLPVWVDDALVCRLSAEKRYAKGEPGVAVTVTKL